MSLLAKYGLMLTDSDAEAARLCEKIRCDNAGLQNKLQATYMW